MGVFMFYTGIISAIISAGAFLADLLEYITRG